MKTDFRRDAKVLFYDLEVAPRLGYYYGAYDVTPIKEVRPPILLSVAWKWLGENKTHCLTLFDRETVDPYNDKLLVNELWNLLDEANVVVGHNCVEENTPILTADLRWVPAKDLKVGDELGAFEEGRKYGTPLHKGGFKQRKYTKAVVESIEIESQDCVEIELDNGEKLVCTPDHLWLGKSKKSEMLHWRMACELEVGDRIPKWFNVWKSGESYEEGWLGGFIEGEGSIKQGRPKIGSFCGIEICQRPTKTWEKALEIIQKLGYQTTSPKVHKSGLGKGDTEYVITLGGRNTTLEIIGRLRIERFLAKLNWEHLGQLRRNKNTIAEHPEPKVVAVRKVGKRNIVKMQTSSKTFFAQGYGSHNCKRFDDKMANYFFIKHGMTPPSPFKEFDTLQTAKKYFKFDCNKLDYLGKLLVGEGKTETTYGDVWEDLLEGNKRERKQASDLMKKYNCLTPDHKVLGTDLKWHEIGSLSVGDTILGFSENENIGTLGRTYQKATVLGNRRVVDDVYKVTLSNGDAIKCTKDHQWLTNTCSVSSARNGKLPGGKKWRKTEELIFNGQRLDGSKSTAGNQFDLSATVIQKLMPVWEEDTSKNAGWLAGMLDGEGSLSNRKTAGGFMLNICQKAGPELDKLGVEIQKHTEQRLDMHLKGVHGLQKQPIGYYTIKGKFWEKLRFLGEVRPERLISNIDWNNLPRMEGRNEAVWVENIEYLGKQEIVILETDTHTYIADGYPMHNCRDVEVLEKIYLKMLPWATNHPNMALYAGQEYICPRCGNDSEFQVKSYRRTGVQINAIQYQCKKCGGYVTRVLTKEEREELKENGKLKPVFRNVI